MQHAVTPVLGNVTVLVFAEEAVVGRIVQELDVPIVLSLGLALLVQTSLDDVKREHLSIPVEGAACEVQASDEILFAVARTHFAHGEAIAGSVETRFCFGMTSAIFVICRVPPVVGIEFAM